MKEIIYRSNGKLMISGEYLVLAGAQALAVPVVYGQTMRVYGSNMQKGDEACKLVVNWLAFENEFEWFRASFCDLTLSIIETNDDEVAETLRSILLQARSMNPHFLAVGGIVNVITKLDFDRNWGLGSSSTLISNIASWADVDPFELLFSTLGGSGYDIACARSEHPLLYRYCSPDKLAVPHPTIQQVPFYPPFADKLVFVYTGNKQSSRQSLQTFRPDKVSPDAVKQITELSHKMASEQNIDVFLELMAAHERIIAYETGMKAVKEQFFDNFPGSVKSLGAWGGDFLLAGSAGDPEAMQAYFRSREFRHIISYRDMVLKTSSD